MCNFFQINKNITNINLFNRYSQVFKNSINILKQTSDHYYDIIQYLKLYTKNYVYIRNFNSQINKSNYLLIIVKCQLFKTY